MNHESEGPDGETPTEGPTWFLQPHQVLFAMVNGNMLLVRPDGGPYLLVETKRAGTPIYVSDQAVDMLLERGWLTRVDDEIGPDALYLLTAEGRRTGARLSAELH
jgi:hypothetical protein